jgi:hypothetical protein
MMKPALANEVLVLRKRVYNDEKEKNRWAHRILGLWRGSLSAMKSFAHAATVMVFPNLTFSLEAISLPALRAEDDRRYQTTVNPAW